MQIRLQRHDPFLESTITCLKYFHRRIFICGKLSFDTQAYEMGTNLLGNIPFIVVHNALLVYLYNL